MGRYCGLCIFFKGGGKCDYVIERIKNGKVIIERVEPLISNRALNCPYFHERSGR